MARPDAIARSLGTSTAQLIVIQKAINGKRPGGAAMVAAIRHGLITPENLQPTEKGRTLLAEARSRGF